MNTTYSYHSATGDFRLKTIDNRDTANNILSQFDYEYSPVGNITQWDQVLGSVRSQDRAYEYDRVNQLIGSTYENPSSQAILKQFDYSYDPVGNRLSEVIHTPSVNETLWSENFTGQNDKGGFVSGGVETTDTAGVDWSMDLSNVDLANDASDDWFQVQSETFEGRDLDGEAVWISPDIDISHHSDVAFTLDATEDGNHESTDTYHVQYSTDGGTTFTDLTNWNGKGDSNHSLIDDWTSETITASSLSGSTFELRVAMENNANTEQLRLDNIAVTGDSEPETLVTEASYNNLNQLTSLSGGGDVTFAGTTDEPATVTVDSQNAELTEGGERFAATIDLPSGTNTVTVEATDVNSNTTNQDYDVDVTAGASRSVSYDANGNMSNNGYGQTYAWDAENRLIQITRGTETTEFTYDGLGRRVRIIEKDNGTETANNRYVWDGTQIVEKRNDTGGSWRQRYYSEGFVDSATGDFFYTRDHLGSIREVVEDDGSTVAARYDYAPYGRTETIGTATQDATFRFTGHFYHAESKLHLAMYRAYDAKLGRWISRDPAGFVDGPNLYAYVGNNSISFWDPLGLKLIPVGSDCEKKMINDALDKIKKHSSVGEKNIQTLQNSKHSHYISIVYSGNSNVDAYDGKYKDRWGVKQAKGKRMGSKTSWRRCSPKHNFSPESVLAHELQHAKDIDQGTNHDRRHDKNLDRIWDNEPRAVNAGDDYRQGVGEPLRKNYNNKGI